jgi:hypothetical protein
MTTTFSLSNRSNLSDSGLKNSNSNINLPAKI